MRRLLLKIFLRLQGGEEPPPWKSRLESWMLRNIPGMLTCEEFEEFVHDYHENILPEKVRRRFEMHLDLCPMCQVHFESYVRTIELGQKLCEEEDELPDDMPEELIGAILVARNEDTET